MQYLNQLEPDSLVQSFHQYPPYNFKVIGTVEGLPAFSAQFDLLTTIDDDFRNKLQKFPLYHYWKKYLIFRTCFVGTTVSEYALFPKDQSAQTLAQKIKAELSQNATLLIVKDIPENSPLLDDATNAYAKEMLDALKAEGFIVVSGQALAWVPINFSSVDEYIQRLSKMRRKDMRRKLRQSEDVVIQSIPLGDATFQDPTTLAHYYELYLNVFQQSEIHFDQLTDEFFAKILQDETSGGIVFTYHHEGQLIGYNICYVVNNKLIDKYVGFVYPKAREKNIYFLSWFHNLNYAVEQGLTQYVAGWTDPEIKSYLGAQFTFTHHAVYIRNPILRNILKPFSGYFESDKTTLEQLSNEEK